MAKKEETKSITDRVKTVAQLIKEAKPEKELLALINYKGKNKHMVGLKNAALLFLIVETYNEGWKPDWKDYNQKKWYPWFDMSSGVGFWGTHSGVGSRLCFKSEELAIAAAKNFGKVYKGFLTK